MEGRRTVRLSEARRYDRSGGHGSIWHGMVRQRYRYDASNQRLVKQTLDASPGLGEPSERVHLYVYPGRFERSGVITDGEGTGLTGFVGSAILGSETHYTVGGARAVRKTSDSLGPLFAPERRLTYAVKDVIQSTSAVVDLISGELLELTTFYPNGARETHRTQGDASVQLELNGFTGKEADEEVGVVYFGERYLIPRIGRWASPDPLAIHAAGGGEALNAYHYVSGNLLQARDPVGLNGFDLVRGIPSPQAVFERIGSELKRAAEYVADVAITVSSVAIEIGISLIPGVGEAEDISVIVDPESTATERIIATTSLTLSVATAGGLPNAGRGIKATRKATSSREATKKPDTSAAHDSSSPPAPRAEAASAESANASNTTDRANVAKEANPAASRSLQKHVLEDANFAQTTYSTSFSPKGPLGGRTIDDVTHALKSGTMAPSELPVDYIVRDGNVLILNTRTSHALQNAGIPRARWTAVDRTGDGEYEKRLTDQLRRNKLTSEGTPTARESGGK